MSDDQLELVSRVDPAPAIQTHRFALVMAGLLRRLFPDLACYNFVPIQDYPIGRKLWFESARFERDGHAYRSLAFVNTLLLKHVTRFGALVRRFREMAGYELLIVHGLHMPNLAFAVLLRMARVRIGVVLTDEHGIILPADGAVRRALKRLDSRLVGWLCGRFDFSIALSPALADLYTPGKPTTILPGIYDDRLEARIRDEADSARRSTRPFRVVYFGGLSAEYGLQALLDALPHFAAGIELRLFGRGPLEQAIAGRATTADNLYWGGLVGQDRLIAEMAGCDLLINARPADGRLARLSSPSKLLEYAASGRPVATTRLPTIPTDVMTHCLPIEASTGVAVADAVNRAAELPMTALAELGRAFQEKTRGRYSADALQQAFATLLGVVIASDALALKPLDAEAARR